MSFLSNIHNSYVNPTFLGGNVATTRNTDENNKTISTSYYSYDIYGRVQWIVQKIAGLGTKTIDYEYDPVTGQVLKVIYQKHTPEELFVHRYTYNIAQELEKVETSIDNTIFTIHAEYQYYETGALKRTELAGGIQGIDYVYNLAGQLKAINHPDLTTDSDTGKDPNDLFGMTLNYYSGDYKRNQDFSQFNLGKNQYNGNIKSMVWNTKTATNTSNAVAYSYQYNKNNWLKGADFYSDASSNGSTNTSEDYKVYGITYDANGNIQSLSRNKNTEQGSNKMDALTYHYKTNKPNQLRRVEDAISTNTNAQDIKNQVAENSYIYDSIGQLIENKDEKVKYEYNTSGLVTNITYNDKPKVTFSYNDKGFRTKKVSYRDDGAEDKVTYYVRDASSSPLAIYENGIQTELPIYGASRLGIYDRQSNTSVYQLTDHLGNVRAVIAKETGTANAAALVHATDYYPFGMPMPNRRIQNGEPYRYGYQDQEKDPETGKEAFQLRLWDGRIGRWLTTDPAGQYFSPYLGMGNNPMNGVDPDGAKFFDWIKNNNTGDIEWFAGTGEFSTNLAIEKWGTDADITTLSTNYFDPTILSMKLGGGMNDFFDDLGNFVDFKVNEFKTALWEIAPDGIEFYASGDVSIGNTKLDGGGVVSYFGDSYKDSDLVRGVSYGGGFGHSKKTFSPEIGVNYFYSQRPESSMPVADFGGLETTSSLTIGYRRIGVTFNYIKGEDYWGWGLGLTRKDIGFFVVRTNTDLHFQN